MVETYPIVLVVGIAIFGAVVLASIFLHGITASPVMDALERRALASRSAGEPPEQPAGSETGR